MEEPFLLREEELVPVKTTWQRGQLTDELKKVGRLAAPMATVTIAQYLLPVISVMIAGHKGELQLSGVALATSFTNVSGFSIMNFSKFFLRFPGRDVSQSTTMEEPILLREEELVPVKTTWQRGQLTDELKKVGRLAAPMATVTIAQYLLPVISVMIAGHKGELQLSGVALATSFTNFSGFSIMFGLVGALDTLCGQAYGAKEYEKIGTYTYSAIASNIPIYPDISRVAGSYAVWLIPALFGHAIVIPSRVPKLFGPALALTTLLFHIAVCWSFVSLFGLGSNGAALAMSVSFWFYAVILACYVRFSTSCEKTRSFVSDDFVSSVKQFFHFGVPSTAMLCLEWWLFELLVLSSGLLPNPKLETFVLSIWRFSSQNTTWLAFGFLSSTINVMVSELQWKYL
ncbi:hypothetical protein F2Q69_00063159 [Brassica cretica]|uniref:Protein DETOXIFICATION n=1 Tax=Brassica cretica TaxID=69181 RepID=A0A8S9RNH8_BRACR|nr:hypothetical protein F2Q69_00063159 [Brassica cretica]